MCLLCEKDKRGYFHRLTETAFVSVLEGGALEHGTNASQNYYCFFPVSSTAAVVVKVSPRRVILCLTLST